MNKNGQGLSLSKFQQPLLGDVGPESNFRLSKDAPYLCDARNTLGGAGIIGIIHCMHVAPCYI